MPIDQVTVTLIIQLAYPHHCGQIPFVDHLSQEYYHYNA